MTALIVGVCVWLVIGAIFAGCFGIERADIQDKMKSMKTSSRSSIPTKAYIEKAERYLRVVNYQRFSLVWPGLVVFFAGRALVNANKSKRDNIKAMTKVVKEKTW